MTTLAVGRPMVDDLVDRPRRQQRTPLALMARLATLTATRRILAPSRRRGGGCPVFCCTSTSSSSCLRCGVSRRACDIAYARPPIRVTSSATLRTTSSAMVIVADGRHPAPRPQYLDKLKLWHAKKRPREFFTPSLCRVSPT
jgi:hypothetical protein